MKILLAAVNAKYIHSNLAVYSLKAYAGDPAVEIGEYTINQQKDDILMDIYKRQPDILCLSCYIWNLDYIEEIVLEIGKLRPDMPIWLGGPEVSYDAKEVLRRLPCVKGVMKGEGEKTFKEICQIYRNESEKKKKNVDNSWKKSESVDNRLKNVTGITFRTEENEIIDKPWRPIMDLSEVPFVYDHIEDFEHKIIYYETSRGCPFSCSYCLSSVDKRLRFRNIELVKKELQFFLDHKVPQVKFVDRTFNCKHDHSIAIWKYIMEHDNGITNFHFEIAADILNEEELELLEQMRPGLVQLEIGVQSTNPKTIKEIHRVMDFEKVSKIVRRIQDKGNVHEHLDLIAGLPYGLLQLRRLFRSVSGNQLPSLLHSPLLSQQNPGHLRCWKEGSPYRLLHLQDLHIHGSDHRCSHPLHLLRCLPEAALPVCGYLRELRLRCR